MSTPYNDVALLLRRAGFGGSANEISALAMFDLAQVVDKVLDTSAVPTVTPPASTLDSTANDYTRWVDHVQWWANRMATTTSPIVEKMTVFWHGHFTSALDKCSFINLWNQQQTFRTLGLGPFETLAQAVAIGPAMLQYLDNRTNYATAPNENWARECMELMTMGTGNYTQGDVVGSALAWSGHGTTSDQLTYNFNAAKHSTASKTIFGISQNWNGPDVLHEIINGSKQAITARFIANKLWTFFAYEAPASTLLDALTTAFVSSGMNIKELLRAMFNRSEFYSDASRHGHVRSPIEYCIAAMKYTGMDSSVVHPEWYLEPMGQRPMNPPNVAGWHGGKSWISTSAIWSRGTFARNLVWTASSRGFLSGTSLVSVATAAQRTFDAYGMEQVSASSRAALESAITAERTARGWAEQVNLITLGLLSPSFRWHRSAMAEMEFEDIQKELSITEKVSRATLSRRAFLQATAAGIGLSMMPDWVRNGAWAAPALGPSDGVLVIIQLGGGNDGLNTVIPTGNSAYYTKRGSLAISAGSALPLATGIGLHPSLAKLKTRYDAGKVAVVQGVGYPSPDLSHFTSVANWQSGWGPGGSPRTGWLGRYLDELGTDPFYGITVGSSIPLHLVGSQTAATSLPLSSNGLFGANQSDPVDQRLANALKAFGASSTGFGSLTDYQAATQRGSVDLAHQVSGCYTPTLPSGNLIPQMALSARLINANLGIRVFGVSCGSFDTHSGQAYTQGVRLQELDDAIETFFANLSPAFANRVTLMTFSEFGRRVEANGSGGTDHGTASPLFVVGEKVKGGLYGAQPSLTSLDSSGNMVAAVDFHSVYATIIEKWFGGDSQQLLGSNYAQIDMFNGAPSGEAIAQPSPAPPPAGPPIVLTPLPSTRPVSFPLSYRVLTTNGLVRSYGGANSVGNGDRKAKAAGIAVTPSQRGYWIASDTGGVYCFGDAPFHGAMTTKLNAPIVGLASTASGNGYWLLGRDGGIFSFGDAAFYGSTGNIKLNQPVVGMTAVPTGGGYWFVAADGGVFCYGPGAKFFGSTGAMRLNKPIVGMASTPTGMGYWLVATDGGVFSFGDALFFGSTGNITLNQPIVGIASTPTGRGYRMVASDGGVFSFGDATFEGSSVGDTGGAQVIGIAT